MTELRKKIWNKGTLTYTAGSLALLTFWLVWGDFTWMMKGRAVGPAATLLIKQIGVSDFVFALIIVAFPNFTNIFLGPIISYMSDRHRGPYGRRIPFLLFTTPFIVLGLFGLGLTHPVGDFLHAIFPVLPTHMVKLTIFVISWVLLDFGTTLAASLFNALVNDVVPKEMLGRLFAIFRIVSLGAGILFNAWILDKVEQYSFWVFIGIGILYGIGLLSMCFNVKEGKYPPAPMESAEKTSSAYQRILLATYTYFRQCFSIPYYGWIMLSSALTMLMFVPINSFAILYAKSLGIDMTRFGIFIVVTYCISLSITFFMGWLADRFHPLRTGIICLGAYVVLMLVSWGMLSRSTEYFGILFILHGVISGCYFTLTASIGPRLFPNEFYAQLSSACGIVKAFAAMTVVPLIGKVLDMLNSNYIWIFPIAAFLTILGILSLIKLYYDYETYGGERNYTPPLP